jgi:2-dehydro-3-deoxyglucarate aldolase/4-hydroxy-2-oxoheptanedioate aldolase
MANLKAMCADRRLKLGTSVFEFDTPGIGHIMKNAGCEYVFIDMEHSGFGIEAMKRLLRYCEAADLPALVRPPSKSTHHIARVLDVGAGGLILPMVADADEAKRIVDAMKYTPQGSRGVALGIAHDRYSAGAVDDKLAAANASTACVALIETVSGLRNVDAIAAVDGVDALWIGHFDLSCSLGIPGQFDHPEFLAATEEVIAAARKHGKALGRLVNTPDEGAAFHRQGFDLICYSGDLWIFQAALTAGLQSLKDGCR